MYLDLFQSGIGHLVLNDKIIIPHGIQLLNQRMPNILNVKR